MVQLSYPYTTTRKTIALAIWIFVSKVMSLLFNMLPRLVIAFLPRNKHLLYSWLRSPSAVSFSSVHFSRLVVSDSLWPHELKHTRLPCPSLTPKVYSNSCPLSRLMPSSHLILCRPLLLLPPIPPSIRVFSNESTVLMRWPKYWSFSFSISPSNEHPGPISFRMDWLDLLAVQGTLKSLWTTVQKHQFFGTQLSSQSNAHIHTWPQEKPKPWLDRPLLAK